MKKVIALSIVIVAVIGITIYAQNRESSSPADKQLQKWEQLAERGDTAAMHRLIEFYDANTSIFVEVAEVIEADGYEWTAAEIDSVNRVNNTNAEMSEQYAARLEYWLNKGILENDPIAILTKGMRLYYEDETKAIDYLSKAADTGNAQAALFCGSACLNQRKENEAFKYLSMAYKLGAPSAGWHLAICYSAGIGTEPNRDKAIEVMRHAAIMNCHEAISEMCRIEPANPVWQNKADSIDITCY